MKLFLASLLLLVLQTSASESLCEERSELKNTISHENKAFGLTKYNKCWKILNPSRYPIRLKEFVHSPNICNAVKIIVTINDEPFNSHSFGLCNRENVIIGSTDVLVNYTAKYSHFNDHEILNFQFSYEIGIHVSPQVNETRLKLVSWLNNARTPSWGWRENTARAIVALFLSDGATFDGTSLDKELMEKQVELKTAIALLRPISNERLSMFINALLVTCNNPRHFYGQNLVRLLKEQAASTRNFTHPIAYLTLCNANETWPSKAFEDLTNVLNSDYKYAFFKDFQAIAVMALSCYRNNNNTFDEFENGSLKLNYERAVKEMSEHQLSDGSFGNIHSTALIVQALISNVAENATNWNVNASLEYLIKGLNSSSVDLVSMTLSLPVLNGKSFVDVAKVNCSTSRRRHDDDDLVSINDYSGQKMKVRYSLYIGEDEDIIHTMYLKVPEKFTAYDVMQLAKAENPKYEFESKRIKNDIYIYRIGSLLNDPEDGTFWLQYLQSRNASRPESFALTAPNHLVLEDEDHLIMWYRRPSL